MERIPLNSNQPERDLAHGYFSLEDIVGLSPDQAPDVIMWQQKIIERLQEENKTDALTGAHNRGALDATLLAEDKRLHQAEGGALCFIDLNNFGLINKNIGDLAGDQILKAIYNKLHSVIRAEEDAIIYRKGGDEFLLVLPGVNSPEHLEAIVERMQSAVKGYIAEDKQLQRLNIGASFGAVLAADYSSIGKAFEVADAMMQQSKRADKEGQAQ